MNLSPDELESLTGKTRPKWQARELDFLCIPYKTRQDGTLIVLKAHVDGMHHQPIPERQPRLRLP